jgi:hypothetical protein
MLEDNRRAIVLLSKLSLNGTICEICGIGFCVGFARARKNDTASGLIEFPAKESSGKLKYRTELDSPDRPRVPITHFECAKARIIVINELIKVISGPESFFRYLGKSFDATHVVLVGGSSLPFLSKIGPDRVSTSFKEVNTRRVQSTRCLVELPLVSQEWALCYRVVAHRASQRMKKSPTTIV